MAQATRNLPAVTRKETIVEFLARRTKEKNAAAGIWALGSSIVQGSGVSSFEYSWWSIYARHLRLYTGLQDNRFNAPNGGITLKAYRSGYPGFSSSSLINPANGAVYKLINAAEVTTALGGLPDIAFLEPGTLNDHGGSGSTGSTLAVYRQNVRTMITYWRETSPTTRIVVLSPNDRTDPLNKSGLTLAEYAAALQLLCVEMNVEYIDVFGAFKAYMVKWSKLITDVLSDTVHPNELGYSYFADAALRYSYPFHNFGLA